MVVDLHVAQNAADDLLQVGGFRSAYYGTQVGERYFLTFGVAGQPYCTDDTQPD
jgi:hypothetical protein